VTEGTHPAAPEHQAPFHPAAAEHHPFFITPPGETDVLLVAVGIFLLMAVIGVGVLYFKLHSLPEQMAHRGQKLQFEIVAVLALLALFTHNHVFWVAALLLALVPLPDFSTPLTSMAQSLRKIAGSDEPTAGAGQPVVGQHTIADGSEMAPHGPSPVPLAEKQLREAHRG
jgi:hypothetical protein